LVFHYNKSVDPVPLTLAEATPAITEVLTTTGSNRAVSDAAAAALAKLNEAVKAGKSFVEAAKGLGVQVESLPNFSESEPPADLADANLIVEAVDGLAEKEISAVKERPGGLGNLIVYVDKIEIYKDPEADAAKKRIAAATETQLDRTLFTAWFNQRRAESGSARSTTPTTL
jgi:hypothetical protein